MSKKQKRTLGRILVTAGLLAALWFVPARGWLKLCLYLVPYLLIGYDILRKAALGIVHGQVFDENFLMATATVGAFALAVASGSGDYLEAIAVMLFYQIGEWFQSYAVGRSRRSIAQLMDIRPDYANIETDGKLERVDPDAVAVGTLITVQPGERVPIDGVVAEGRSTLDAAALTGESLPREVGEGDEVLSGCVNLTGLLRLRTTKEAGESTAAKILDLVENASARKSRSETFISRFARVYTPAVCGAALVLAVLPPLALLALGQGPRWSVWLYRALAFLVTSCPCALVISIPLSFFAGIGGASRAGVLVKGSNYLETLSQVRQVAFDKTGTLTQGVFQVVGVHGATMPREQLLAYAALAESASSHPISKSLQKAWGGEPDRDRVRDIQERGGNGVLATVDGHAVAAGSERLMAALEVPCEPCQQTGTVVHVAVDGNYAGHILIADVVKPQAGEALRQLKAAGVEKTVMLTGDNARTAQAVAQELGVDQVHSDLLPADKVAKVEELLAALPRGKKLAFVGDGINDAPVLSRADVGIAMGALGSDAAIEAADVVLMDDDPAKLAQAIRISKKCLGIVYQNIVFAIGIKLLCLVLVAVGVANMWLAIFADVGVMVLAVLNAMRCLKTPK